MDGSTHGSWPGRRRRWLAAAALALVAAAAAYAAIPRRADLTSFDPEAMARLETSMWRHYYEQRYVALFLDLNCLWHTACSKRRYPRGRAASRSAPTSVSEDPE